MENQEEQKKPMSATEVTMLLSQTMRDVAARKITLRHALAVSRVATALTRVIETTDLNARVEFLEQMLKKRK